LKSRPPSPATSLSLSLSLFPLTLTLPGWERTKPMLRLPGSSSLEIHALACAALLVCSQARAEPEAKRGTLKFRSITTPAVELITTGVLVLLIVFIFAPKCSAPPSLATATVIFGVSLQPTDRRCLLFPESRPRTPFTGGNKSSGSGLRWMIKE